MCTFEGCSHDADSDDPNNNTQRATDTKLYLVIRQIRMKAYLMKYLTPALADGVPDLVASFNACNKMSSLKLHSLCIHSKIHTFMKCWELLNEKYPLRRSDFTCRRKSSDSAGILTSDVRKVEGMVHPSCRRLTAFNICT